MKRELIELTVFEIAPLLDENARERDEYYNHDEENDEYTPIEYPLWNEFEHIQTEVEYYDLDKSYESMITILKRKSDGKYFMGTWTDSPHAWNGNDYDTTLTEVFPKEITKIIYE